MMMMTMMMKLSLSLLLLLLSLSLQQQPALGSPIAPTTLDGATPIDAQVSAADFGALDAFAEDAAENSQAAASEAGFKVSSGMERNTLQEIRVHDHVEGARNLRMCFTKCDIIFYIICFITYYAIFIAVPHLSNLLLSCIALLQFSALSCFLSQAINVSKLGQIYYYI